MSVSLIFYVNMRGSFLSITPTLGCCFYCSTTFSLTSSYTAGSYSTCDSGLSKDEEPNVMPDFRFLRSRLTPEPMLNMLRRHFGFDSHGSRTRSESSLVTSAMLFLLWMVFIISSIVLVSCSLSSLGRIAFKSS